jgi:hypothetical protein
MNMAKQSPRKRFITNLQMKTSNAGCVPEAVTKQHRSGTATGPQQQANNETTRSTEQIPATSSTALQELRVGKYLRTG